MKVESRDMKKIVKLVISILICQGAGFLGSIFTTPAIPTWYAALQKPGFTPANWIFGPAWTILYFLMGISLYLVWSKNWEIKVLVDRPGPKAWNRFSEKLWRGDWRKENVMAIFALQKFLLAPLNKTGG